MTASTVRLVSIALLILLHPLGTAMQDSSVRSLRVRQMATPIPTFLDSPRLESVQKATPAPLELLPQHHVLLALITHRLVKPHAYLVLQDSSAMNLVCRMTLSRYKIRNAMQDTTVLILALMRVLQLPLVIQFQMP